MRDDESKNWHNYLIMQVPREEFSALKAKFEEQVPKLACWAIIRNGNPFIVFEYGGTIRLNEEFGSGETLGDKLFAGDIATVILTDKAQNELFTPVEGNLKLNFNLEDVIIYAFTYTKEMEQVYGFYKHYINIKETKRDITIKNKPKRLSLR